MSKETTSFICNNCSYKTIKWLGCCPTCSNFDSFIEQKIDAKRQKIATSQTTQMPVSLISVSLVSKERISCGISEWDRVLGGGLVVGSLIVLTGDPGIGKSTLLLQVCNALAKNKSVLYVSTEESLEQIKQRAQRIGALSKDLFVYDTTSFANIHQVILEQKPDILIIDSIQNCYIESAETQPGSISQLRVMTFELMKIAKEKQITTIITSHITKEGIIAGPKTLEHMVDAVFYLQGEDQWDTRVLLAVKNRFGSLQELGFFRMETSGLLEVPNINEDIIDAHVPTPGSILVSTTESTRPLLFELQALVIETKLAFAQRIVSGVEHKQVTLIAAILEKYLKIRFSAHDIFFKVSGGFKTKSNAVDLGIALSLLSSYFQKPLPGKMLACGEIGLTGHVKSIAKLTPFMQGAHKFAIEHVVVAKTQNMQHAKIPTTEISHVVELLSFFN